MGTQYVYNHSIAGFLLLAALVALACGGCGETVSNGCPVLEPVWSAPCIGNSDEVAQESDEGTVTISDEPNPDRAEAGVLGYSDPEANEAKPTPSLTEDGDTLEQIGDTEAGDSEQGTSWMADWGEDRLDVVNEESNGKINEGGEPGNYHNGMYEETPCTPPVTEQEYMPEPVADSGQAYTSEPTNDGEREYMPERTGGSEEEYRPEPTSDPEQEYMREPAGDGDDAGSDTIVPYLDGEDETTVGGECFDGTSDGLGSVMMNRMNWMWVNNVRLVLNPWWQAMMTGADETDVPRYEADLPSTLGDVDTSGSSCDPEAGSSP